MADIDKLQIEIEAESTKAIKGINELIDALKKLKSSGNAGGALGQTTAKVKELNTAMSKVGNAARSFQSVAKSSSSISTSVKGAKDAANGAAKSFTVLHKAVQGATMDINFISKAEFDNLTKEMDRANSKVQKQDETLAKLYDKLKALETAKGYQPDSKEAQQAAEALKSYKQDASSAKSAASKLSRALEGVNGNTIQIPVEQAQEYAASFKEASERAKSSANEAANAIKTVQQATKLNGANSRESDIVRLSREVNSTDAQIKKTESTVNSLKSSIAGLQKEWQTTTVKAQIEEENGKLREQEAILERLKSKRSALSTKVNATSGNGSETGAEIPSATVKVSAFKTAISGIKQALVDLAPTASSVFGAIGSAAKSALGGIVSVAGKATKAVAGIFAGIAGSAVSKVVAPFKAIAKQVNDIKSSFGRVAFYRIIRTIESQLAKAFTTGINNIYQYSKMFGTEFAPSMDKLATSTLYLKNSLGALAAPIISAIAPAIEYLIDKFVSLINVIGMAFAALTGKSSYTKAVKYPKEYAAAAEDAAQSTKDWTLGIDELNVISKDTGSVAGGATDDYGSMFEETQIPTEIADWAQSMRDAIEAGDWQGAGSILANKLNEVIDGWDSYSWGVSLGKKINNGLNFAYGFLTTFDFEKFGSKVADGLNGIIDTVDWGLIGRTLGASLNAAIDVAYGFFTTFEWGKFGTALGTSVNGFFDEVDWAKAANTLFEGIHGVLTSVREFIKTVDWYSIGKDISTFLKNIDWATLMSDVATIMGETLGAAILGIWGLIEDAWNTVVDWWYENAYEDGKFTIAGLFKGIDDALRDVVNWIKEHIVDPFLQGFCDLLGIHSPSTVFAEIGTYVIEGFLQGISETWQSVLDFFTVKLPEWWDSYIKPWFTLDKWEALVSSIGTSIKNAWDNTVKEWATSIKNWWDNDVAPWFSLDKWKGIAKNALSGLSQGFSDLWNKGKEWGQNLLNGFTSPDALDEHSPSKAFREIGEYAVEGFFNGFGNMDDLTNVAKSVLDTILTEANSFSEQVLSILDNVNKEITNTANLFVSSIPKSSSFTNSEDSIDTGTSSGVKSNISMFSNEMGDLKDALNVPLQETLTQQMELWTTHFENLTTTFTAWKESTTSVFSTFYTDTLDALNTFSNQFTNGWTNLCRGFVNITIAHGNSALAALEECMNSAISAVNRVVSEINSMSWITGISLDWVDNITIKRIPYMANGGYVDQGQLFVAREAGPELVGSIGNKTAVANNEQIVEGIQAGVTMANDGVIAAIYELLNAVIEKDTSIFIGDDQIGRSYDRYSRSRGVRVNTGAFANAY